MPLLTLAFFALQLDRVKMSEAHDRSSASLEKKLMNVLLALEETHLPTSSWPM
jgi:hypothetical protein